MYENAFACSELVVHMPLFPAWVYTESGSWKGEAKAGIWEPAELRT